jgi:hypothetical protein
VGADDNEVVRYAMKYVVDYSLFFFPNSTDRVVVSIGFELG